MLEKSAVVQRILLIFVMIGVCMVIGDGPITLAISVLSAVQGIQDQNSKLTKGAVVGVSAAILLLLFLLQRYGTGKVSFMFSPIAILWFVCNTIIGEYNIIKYYPAVFKAASPHYIIRFLMRNGKHGWVLLGGTVLAIIEEAEEGLEKGETKTGNLYGDGDDSDGDGTCRGAVQERL